LNRALVHLFGFAAIIAQNHRNLLLNRHSGFLVPIHHKRDTQISYLKCEMAGFTVSPTEDILSEIRKIFREIPRETLGAVYNEWIPTIG
jgi:hypothetical protein